MFRLLILLVAVSSFNLFPALGHASTLASELSDSLGESRRVVSLALSKSRNGQSAAAEISRLTALRDELAALRLLHSEQNSSIVSRASTLDGNALERQQAVSSSLSPVLDDLIVKLDAAIKSGSTEDLQQLQDTINRLSPSRPRPLLGALPYKHSGYPPREPASTSSVVPAYRGGDRNVYPADTAESSEAPLTGEIAELAQSLQWNPVLIYEWVKNNVETEWYWGSMKGAGETLRQKSGNDADQASLLVALLRAANFPARYVRGTIDFFPGIEHAKNLTGLDDPLKIADFLRKAGIPFKPVISGGGITNFHLEHIWAEAFIPYANYRGAVLDEQGKLWLGLDTSIKPRGYSRTQGAGVPSDLLATLRDDFLMGIQVFTPLEYLAAKLDEQLAESQPGKTWKDLSDTTVLVPDILKIIPDSLQFNQIAVTGEYQSLPDELKHKLIITATAGGNELFSITQETHKLSNKRLALRAEPETVEDQNIIDSFGGLDNTPSYLVRLRPVLTLDGERLIVARDGLPMGGDFTLNIDIITPNGTERISSSQVNGNLSLVGVVAQKAQAPTAITESDNAEAILHKEAIGYIDRWNKSEDDLAALLGQRITRPTVTIVTVGGQIEVAYLLDSPHDFQWKGLYLDAGYRRIETTGRNGLERDFMRLSALHGSILENRIFEDDLKVDSVSTAKLLQLAKAGGMPMISIDKAGIDAILPTLAFDDAVKADITNAVNQGLTVSMPLNEVTYQDWSGIGYIKENPVTGEAGWMLSGQVAGGMTAATQWVNDYLMSVMHYYNSVPSTEPPARMLKVSATDQQSGTVGKDLPQKLAVMVLDKYGRPVRDANVTFSVTAGGGAVTTSQPVRSLPNGIAAVDFTPGKKTSDNSVYIKLTPLDQELTRVGNNIVSATLETPAGNVELKNPFDVYGLPDVPARIVKTFGDNTRTLVNNPAGSLQVMVVDQYDNPVSNVALRYKADPPRIALQPSPPISLPAGTRNISLYLPKSCSNPYPIFGECASTDSVELKTAYNGCFVNTILGDTVNTLYTVKVSTPSLPNVPTENFSLYSQGNRPDGRYLPPSLVVRYLERYTAEGQPINAAALGKPLETPLTAELLLITDEYSTEGPHTCTRNIQNIAETYDCWRIVPSGKSLVTKVTSATLAFQATSGEGSVSSTTDLLNGKYQATFTAGPNPQKNTVGASGSALVTVPEVFYDSDKQMAVMDGYRSGILRQRSLNLATNKQVLFDRFRFDPDPIPVLGDTEKLSDLIIFSVKATLAPLPPIWVDQNYIAEQDVRLELKVEPAEYRAGLSQIVQNLNGKPYSYYPANQSGSDSLVLLKNSFSFNPKDSHDFQAKLNSGSPVEIRSNQVPLQIVGGHVEVQRTHILSQFDPVVPPGVGTSYLDSYKPLPIKVDTPATVRVAILDNNRLETATLVPSTSLGSGDYNFVIDYQQVRDSGFDPAVNPEFFILVEKTFGDPPILHTSLHSGRISDRTEGKMLGQTIVHDVMIQDGSLNLSRQDMAFTGRGPQLAISRSYNNQSSPRNFSPLGNGWSHSLDMKLRPISSSVSGPGGLPTWVVDSRGSIVPESAIPTTPPSWTMVQVNGAIFKKHNNVWYSERGHHGTLEELPTTPASFVFTAKDGTRYSYDSALGDMPVYRIEDRNGNAMFFVYNGQQLSQVTDAVGRKCNFSYDSPASVTIAGDRTRLVGVSCSDAVEIHFDYHPSGYLKSAKRGDRLETYDYAQESGIAGAEYNLVKATDANNHSFSYEYHTLTSLPFASWNAAKSLKPLRPQDVIKSVAYPGNGTTPVQANFAYSTTTANQRTVTDLRGNDTVYTLNYFGNPLRIEEPLGKITLMTWSIDEGKPDNVMTSKTDPLVNVTIYEYDPQGNVKKETDPYGKFVATVWNQKFSLPESRTDRNNINLGWQYDPKGNLLQETDGDNKQTSHTYYSTGERQSSRDPLGNTTSFTYDAWGNPASVKGAEGSLTKYEYDIRGRRIALIDPNGKRTEYAYDALDQPTTTTFPQHDSYALATGSTRIKTQIHDAVGNLLSETDRLGLALTYSYTPRNQVKSITRSSGGTKTFDYDNNGNLISESDWKGAASSHTYDALNRRDSSTNRLGYSRLMKYDLNGNLTEEQDAEGRVTNHEYDKLNRLTKTIQPALTLQVRGELAFSYYDEADPKTNLKKESDQEGNVTSYEYNGRYLRSKRTNALNDVHLWEYDDNGNLNKETDEESHFVRHEYDKQNRLIADVHSHNGSDVKTGYGYDAAGNRTSVTDPLGHITTNKYDEWNRPWQTIDAENFTASSELDGEGNKVKTIDANGNIRSWTRDPRGLVLSGIDGEGIETKYTYDLNGNNETITYANTSVTSIAYDAEDRKTITTEAQGQTEERSNGVILYDKVGNPLKVKDGNGNITTSEFNALNLPIKVTDTKGKFSSSDYYKTGKVNSVTNRRNATTKTEYDKLWRVTKVTDPLNQTNESVYDKAGNLLAAKDKRGITSETSYDDLYRPTEKKRAGLRLVNMEYDNANNLTADIDANGNRTEYAYNKRNQKEKVTFADATVRRMTYDGNGNLISEIDEEGIVTSHGYDRENRPTATERAGELTQKSYNEMGDLAAIIHPEGNSRTFNYDKLKRMISAIDDPWGPGLTTRYEYDKNGNLTKSTDARGNVVENAYDELNRKTGHMQRKAVGDLITSYGYDDEGNLTRLTDAKGQVSTYVYDLLNRKTESHYSGLDIATGYDENNNLKTTTVSGTSSDGTSNTYDDFDRLKTSSQRGTTVSYSYDNNGNRLSVGTPGNSTGYGYDVRNRVKTATAGTQTTGFDYYADGKKKTVTYPNGAKEEYEYYASNRVKTLTNSLNSAVISKFAYSYDRNGNRLSQDEARGTRNISTGYTYDSLDRMVSYSVTENSATTRTDYTFDGYNRKTESTISSTPLSTSITKTYSYDETDWLIQLQDGSKTITYSYDNNGNTIGKTDSSAPGNDFVFEYDARDKLIKAGKGASVLGTYSYNANGYRIRQNNSDRGDVEYLYDGTAVIEERNAGGLLAHYRYANKLYSLFDGTQNLYYHLDALGSTTDLTDDGGATKASYFLNPWGMIVDSIGSSVNRRVFTGKEIDQNTGLVYFGARYYDPDTARFTTQDTYLGEQNTPPSLHRFLYAYSNPTVYIDLEGYASEESEKSLWGRFTGWVEKKKEQASKWVGKQAEGLTNRFRGNFQANTHRRLAEAEGSNPDEAEAASRQHTAEIAKDSGRQAAELSRPVVEGVEITAETAAGAGVVKGVGFVAGITNKIRNAKALVTIEDKAGAAFTKFKNLIKEEKIAESEANTLRKSETRLSPTNYPNPDPPMDVPPVRYEPSTIEEVKRMRKGQGPRTQAEYGTQNIEAHHRQQVPVSEGGKLDEITEEVHRRNGNHTRHQSDSRLSPKQRTKEIREHRIKRGSEYILPGEGI